MLKTKHSTTLQTIFDEILKHTDGGFYLEQYSKKHDIICYQVNYDCSEHVSRMDEIISFFNISLKYKKDIYAIYTDEITIYITGSEKEIKTKLEKMLNKYTNNKQSIKKYNQNIVKEIKNLQEEINNLQEEVVNLERKLK